MKLLTRVKTFIGLNPQRAAQPPAYRFITDGVLVTTETVETVLQVEVENTDVAALDEQARMLEAVMQKVGTALERKECHLRVVWGRISGAGYVDELREAQWYNAGNWESWAADRAQYIDDLDLPRRYVFLHIVEQRERLAPNALRAFETAADLTRHELPDRTVAQYLARARRTAQSLNGAHFKVRLAAAELIAWSISREMYRPTAVDVPADGALGRAQLAYISRGKMVPYSDHVRLHADNGSVSAYVATLVITDFPETMTFPGHADWIRKLGDVAALDEDGIARQVIVEASVRFRILPARESTKLIEGVREKASEQIRSAAKVTVGEPPADVQETEDVMREVGAQMKRGELKLVEMHPRIIVSAESRAELDDKIAAVKACYADAAISVDLIADDQGDLWLEHLPGDQLRVTDLGHVADTAALFGSMFWGGSDVGEFAGPIIGSTTGSTPNFVRFDPIGGAKRGDATTTFMGGISGTGKSVCGAVLSLEAAFQGAWSLAIDVKGDLGGLITAAQHYGLTSGLITLDDSSIGALDLFSLMHAKTDDETRREAEQEVQRQLNALLPPKFSSAAEDATLEAVQAVAQQPHPSAAKCVQWLSNHEKPEYQEMGAALQRLAKLPLGRLILEEPPEGGAILPTTPGMWLVQIPGLNVDQVSDDPTQWDAKDRLSVTVLRAVTTVCIILTSDRRTRTMPKFISVPELHKLLGIRDGQSWFSTTARIGRAMNTHLMGDSQDVTGVAGFEGIVEQISSAFIFSLSSKRQTTAAAELVKLEPGSESRDLIQSLSATHAISDVEPRKRGVAETTGRKGHAIMLDHHGRTATVQFDIWPQLLEMLNTSHTGTGARNAAATTIDYAGTTRDDTQEVA